MATAQKACIGCKESSLDFAFTMAFQPIVDLREQRIDGHEALVRGPDGEGAGAVLAKLTPDNLYAFDQACRVRAIEMAAALGLDGQLGINFLPNAVYDPRACIRRTLEVAERTGFPLDPITFEFVEKEVILDTAHTLGIIQEYRRLGFKVALDDFGTGYSDFLRLAELKPDIIKVDREVLKDCDRDPTRLAIVRSLVSLAQEIAVTLVAEGVERIEEVEALRAVGVRFMQGFYFARPLFQGVVRHHEVPWPGTRSPA